jgi:uncharacterized protein DUF4386
LSEVAKSGEKDMTDRTIESAPQLYARIGGTLYLIIILIGLFGEAFVRDKLIVSGDAAATAKNVMASESLWRFHIAAELFLLICAVVLLMILFVLLKPVSRELTLLAAFFNLVSISLEAVITLYLLVALFPLANAGYLKAFAPEQLYALANLSLKSHGYGFSVSLLFFGCFCIVIGRVIFLSGFLPKVIGVLMQIAGLCYLTDSFALVLAPALANRLFPTILLPAFVGEASLCLWLLVRGVNVQRWKEQASAAGTGNGGHGRTLE